MSVAATSRRSSRVLRRLCTSTICARPLTRPATRPRTRSLAARTADAGRNHGALVVLPKRRRRSSTGDERPVPVRRSRSVAAAQRSHPHGVGRARVRRRSGDAAPADARPPSNRGDHRTAGMAGDGGSPCGLPRRTCRRRDTAGTGLRGRLRLPGRTGRTGSGRTARPPRAADCDLRVQRTRSAIGVYARRASAGCASRKISPLCGFDDIEPAYSSRRRSRLFRARSARWTHGVKVLIRLLERRASETPHHRACDAARACASRPGFRVSWRKRRNPLARGLCRLAGIRASGFRRLRQLTRPRTRRLQGLCACRNPRKRIPRACAN